MNDLVLDCLESPVPRPLALSLLTALAALPLVATGSARAGFVPAEVVDGPSAELVRVGDLDLARDGTGAVVYVKRDGGADHIFASRFEDGAFQPPERLDTTLSAPSSSPVIGAADNGRLAAAWVNDGHLYVSVKGTGGGRWTAPQQVGAEGGVARPSIDMSINGAAYVSYTAAGASAADVRVARLERRGEQFTPIPQILDIQGASDAGATERTASRVALAADGTGLVTWGEPGSDGRVHVYGRRVFNGNVSSAPQDLTVDSFQGAPAGDADSPDLDIEDDSSFAWVVFRQAVAESGGTRTRILARRLVGSRFEAPVAVDGLGGAASESADQPRIELNGRGVGIAVSSREASFQTIADLLQNDAFSGGTRLASAPSTAMTSPVSAIGENEDGIVAWLRTPGGLEPSGVRARYLDDAQFGPDTLISNDAFGPVDAADGLHTASNRAGDAIVAFIQGGPLGRRLVASLYDRAPGAALLQTSERYKTRRRPLLAWTPSFELLGPVRYVVELDGAELATTGETRITPPRDVGDGQHRWRVIAVDRRGQRTASRTRTLRVDATPPTVTLRVTGSRRARRAVRFRVRANDVQNPRASGVRSVVVAYGDGSRSARRNTTHRYARRGRYTVTVTVRDRAGNVSRITKRLRIGRP